jgi:hypothetical protein
MLERLNTSLHEIYVRRTILTIPMSDEYKQYASSLEKNLESIYAVAKKAREKGLDPALVPESEVATDLAALV